MNKTIFIAGGGTGGHLFPAISIGQELIKNNYSIIFIGSKFGIEKDFFSIPLISHSPGGKINSPISQGSIKIFIFSISIFQPLAP